MSSRSRVRPAVCALVALGATAVFAQDLAPHHVVDTARGAVATFDAMADEVAKADVVVVGEQHDSANTHRLERALLERLARLSRRVILSLEMFERDVQEPLEHFAMGHIMEEDFLDDGRPWPRYRTDYKPLVDFAIGKEWPIVAANVPRAIASEVAKAGLDVLQSKADAQKKLFAKDLECPTDDAYFKRFIKEMGEHSTGSTGTTERYYFAQCLKDETMAESVAQAYTASAARGAPALVVHFTGAFHADFGQGTVERIRRRLPGKRVAIVSMLPVETLPVPLPDAAERRRADFLVYTIKGKE